LSGIMAIIDLIAVLPYIITQHPLGIAKTINYTALIQYLRQLRQAEGRLCGMNTA
jgi:hypothetical protein